MDDSKRIPSLDGCRAIAILAVVYCHSAFPRTGKFANKPFDWGMLGVYIFFVISGFLITALLQRELVRTGSISLQNFYIRRAWRILPPLLLFLFGVGVLKKLGLAYTSGRALLFCLTFLVNYHSLPYRILDHLWSLSVEEQFYLVWPFLFSYLARRTACRLLVGVIVVVPIIRVITLVWLGHTSMDGQFEQVSDGLACGCLLAIKQKELRASRFYQWLSKSYVSLLLPCVIMLATCPYPQFLQQGIAKSVIFLSSALAIDIVMLRPGSPAGAILNFPPMVWIGRISYSLYLWQQVFFIVRAGTQPYAWFPLNLALAFLCATLSYYLIELPAIAFGRKIIARRVQASSASVAY